MLGIGLVGSDVIALLTTHTEVQNAAIARLQWFHLILGAMCLSYWLDGVFIGLTRSLEMCLAMVLATGIGWFGGLAFTGGASLDDLFIALFSFGLLRTLFLASRLPAARRSIKPLAADHPTTS